MPPGGAPLRMKMSCRGATCGRPSAVAVDIVASVIPERAGTGPAPVIAVEVLFSRETRRISKFTGVEFYG